MVSILPNNATMRISNAIIENVSSDNRTTLITVSYTDRINNRRSKQTVRLAVNNHTTILDENGNFVPASALSTGMTINAVVSSAMTRSIPPQALAYMIRIVGRPLSDNITMGRILDIDRQNRTFTTINDRNPSSIMRFNVPMDAIILDRSGRRVDFSRLFPGQQVQVRHASFMTASIPPQTTAFEIRIL